MHKCYGKCNGKECINFTNKVDEDTLEELSEVIRELNVNLHKFARDYRLSYEYFMKALRGKMPMTWKQLVCIRHRLLESDEWLKFEEDNPSGLCETNHFYDDFMMT